jgi:hypothetical protein
VERAIKQPGGPDLGYSEQCEPLDHQFIAVLSYKYFLDAHMLICELCKQSKPDVRRWPPLRVVDQDGTRTVDPFNGLLCDHCHEEAQRFGSLEHRWVLEQIAKTPRRKRAQQY